MTTITKDALQLTVSPEYLAALTQLNANLAAVGNLLAANQQLLTELLQRSPQLVKLPLAGAEIIVTHHESEPAATLDG